MDVLFKNDDVIFSYRVAGILIHNDKVLLQRPENATMRLLEGMLVYWRQVLKH